MNVTVQLPAEAATKLQEKAAQQGATLEEFLAQIALHWVAEINGTPSSKTAEEKTPQERSAAWQSWVASHKPGSVIADDSRQSIYAGRGE